MLFYTAFIIKEHFQIFKETAKQNIENEEMSFIFS